MKPRDVLLFGDECGIQSVPSRIRMWGLKGHTPTILSPGGREKQSVIAAVEPKTGVITSGFIPTLTATVFMAFLKHVLFKYANARKIYLVLDNARSHHAKLLKPFLKLVARKLELIFLPPYSPELNPAEDLWKLLREKCTHDIYYEHFSDKIAETRKFLVKCKTPSAEVRSQCHYK
jgi:putative transposase